MLVVAVETTQAIVEQTMGWAVLVVAVMGRQVLHSHKAVQQTLEAEAVAVVDSQAMAEEGYRELLGAGVAVSSSFVISQQRPQVKLSLVELSQHLVLTQFAPLRHQGLWQ
jgi:hypothetical protein